VESFGRHDVSALGVPPASGARPNVGWLIASGHAMPAETRSAQAICLGEAPVLKEGVSDHDHQCVTVKALPGSPLESDQVRVPLSTADGPARKPIVPW
jgi:hypothetical protein